ncbi:hypothetical protein C1645_744075 [Glomus cerebriforme]|uniref:Uncharacterized protein n=1 Tax=Glomus cerebriforme TaxID=658196 RepID=A0A397SBD4_9GLOM|nr:hypothetical protein C1645_744075 [Glomus cerebriforme]
MALTISDSILHKNIYNINNIYNNQNEAKISNFIIQLNDSGILGKITRLRLISIQDRLWLEQSPLIEFNEDLKLPRILMNNFILKIILLSKNLNIEFAINDDLKNTIKGGKYLIRGKLLSTTEFNRNVENLRDFNIMFFDQLTSLSGTHLIPWKSICKKRTRIHSSLKLKSVRSWYNIIKDKVTINSTSLKLKDEWITENTIDKNLKGIIIERPREYTKTSCKYILSFYPDLGFVIGKQRCENNIDRMKNTVIFNHFLEETENTTDSRLTIRKCSGCAMDTLGKLNIPYVIGHKELKPRHLENFIDLTIVFPNQEPEILGNGRYTFDNFNIQEIKEYLLTKVNLIIQEYYTQYQYNPVEVNLTDQRIPNTNNQYNPVEVNLINQRISNISLIDKYIEKSSQ